MSKLSLIAFSLLCSISYLAAMETTLNIANATSWTPLHAAVSAGNHAAVKTLLEHGAQIDARTLPNNRTPLMFSAEYGQCKITNELLVRGAIVDQTDSKHTTALHIACQKGCVNIVETLILAEASVEDDFGNGSALNHALTYKDYSDPCMLITLQRSLRLRQKQKAEAFDAFPLHSACQADDPEKVQQLVLNGACLTALDASGNSPLHYAAVNPNSEILSKLLTAIKTKSNPEPEDNSSDVSC